MINNIFDVLRKYIDINKERASGLKAVSDDFKQIGNGEAECYLLGKYHMLSLILLDIQDMINTYEGK